ncbi:MAG: MFS transporter [Planctomycetota bacterium]|nr:MFS transporter [Planctomycetota bacterium]
MILAQNKLVRTVMLCLLYFAQGFPYGFVLYFLLTIFLDSGYERSEVAIISGFALLPWSFKFIWGPMIDSLRWPSLGIRRPWILFAQLGMAFTLLINERTGDLSNLSPDGTITVSPWLVKFFNRIPGSNIPEGSTEMSTLLFVAGLFFVHNCFASLQDVATDALAVDILEENERGRVNGFMWASKLLGTAVGTYGGAVLIDNFGLNFTIQALAGMVLVIAFFVLMIRERECEKRFPWSHGRANDLSTPALRSPMIVLKELIRALSKWTTGAAVGLAILTSLAGGIFIPLAADTFVNIYEWSSLEYSKLQGSYGVLGELIGAIGGGFLCDRFGRRKMAFIGGLGMGLALILFAFQLKGFTEWSPAWIVPVFKGLVAFQTVSLFSLYMKISWTSAAATQFTLYMAVSNFGTYFGNEICRIESLSRFDLFLTSGVCSFIPLLLIVTLKPDQIVETASKDSVASVEPKELGERP